MSPEVIVGGKTPRTKAEIERCRQRPPLGLIYFDNIPQVLRDLDRWVLWNYRWREDAWSKVPFSIECRRGKYSFPKAKSNDPATWKPYTDVIPFAIYHEGRGRYGIGFEFGTRDMAAAAAD